MQIAAEQWPALSRLFDEALALEPGAREDWLAQLAPADAALASPLCALLQSHRRVATSDFLHSLPRLDVELLAHPPPEEALAPGSNVGGYILDEVAGYGGMSVVYRAHRADGLIKRSVALKLLQRGPGAADAVARFARERDILGGLTHPNIARIYDAGTSSSGQPYIALEFIEGLPLTDYCDRHQLAARARLELFGQVLTAVQFAHANLVIHRDLKPSNILVTAEGDVRLLDFGIAKLLPTESPGPQAQTEIGQRTLTPSYSAPEQITGGMITTGTDVYSAGVVLCELLTGERPYRLTRHSLGALEQAIVSIEPVRPSRSYITAEQALARATSPARLRSQLAGDLDTILLKALKKNPLERYATVDAMLQDLQRHLRGEAVLARPDQPWYRVGRFVARHKVSVALVLALLVAIIAGLGVALWALNSARAQAARAEAAKGFLVKIFSTGNPSKTDGRNITAKEILARGSRQIDAELGGQPALLGELHSEIADVYSSLGANQDVLLQARTAVRLLEASGDRTSDAYFHALYRVAESYMEEARWSDARAAYQNLHAAARAQFGEKNKWEGHLLEDLIAIEQANGHLPEAESAAAAALAMAQALYGERSPQYMRVLGTSEQLYLDRGHTRQALELTQRLITLAPSVPTYGLADRLMDRYMLASTLYRLQRYEDSAAGLRKLVPEMESNMGLANDRSSKARNTLALDLMQLGDLTEALTVQQRNVAILQQAGVDDEDLLNGQSASLARILARADRFDEAIPLQRRALMHYDKHYAAPTVFRELMRVALGDMLLREGEVPEAVQLLEASVANLNSIAHYHPDPIYAEALQAEGNGYRLLGRSADAQEAFVQACGLFASLLGERSVAALRCRVYQLLDSAASATAPPGDTVLQQFRSVRDEFLQILPPHQALRAELLLVESQLLHRAGFAADGKLLKQRGIQSYRSLVGRPPHLPLRSLH